MLSLATLQTIHGLMKGPANQAQAELTALNARIAKIEQDNSRHPGWIREKTAEAREVTLSKIAVHVAEVNKQAGVAAQRRFWESKELLMSRRAFDPDPAKDAVIRSQYRSELNAMPTDLLQLVADSAKQEKNLPLLWQARLAGAGRKAEEGWTGVFFDDVDVPEQRDALNLIGQCQGLISATHSAYSQATGKPLSAIDKMTAAREQRAFAS